MRSLEDLRHVLRRLWDAPGFTVVAVATLALGIGVNTAIFSLTHALLLKSLPVRSPSELYSLGDNVLNGDTGALQDSFTLYSYPLYRQLQAGSHDLGQSAAVQSWAPTVSVRRAGAQNRPRPYRAEFVSGNYFATLGIGAFLGRPLGEDD